jgi:hypothetical protein
MIHRDLYMNHPSAAVGAYAFYAAFPATAAYVASYWLVDYGAYYPYHVVDTALYP